MFIASVAFCHSCEREADTSNLIPVTAEPRDAARDAADLELAKTVATKLAADTMHVRTSEDIHDLTNWLLPHMIFNMCGNRLYKGQFVAFNMHALIEKEKFPTDLTYEVIQAYTREDNLSMHVKANGFVFEENDELIMDFKKQEDGSYKMSQGTILTCKDDEPKAE